MSCSFGAVSAQQISGIQDFSVSKTESEEIETSTNSNTDAEFQGADMLACHFDRQSAHLDCNLEPGLNL